jgi:diguanylate cyclase (GGDEF)-like protein
VSLLATIERQRPSFKMFVGFALIGAIGTLDFLTGYELAFSLFYVIPIAFTTWLIDQRYGLVASLASASVWLAADIAAGQRYSHPLVPVWNALIRLSFFVIITLLLSSSRSAAKREKEFARTDYLTGAVNSRLLFELLQTEMDRSQRYGHPFTVTYIDLDDFKIVNDRFGHSIGDQVLRTVVNYAREHLRRTDVIARLAGDEFVLLLPETGQDSARVALGNLQTGLLEELHNSDWLITFSAGAVTCTIPPTSTDDLVRMADDLMYSVKRSGKNAIRYSTYTG